MAQQRGIGHCAFALPALSVDDIAYGYGLVDTGHIRRVLRLGRRQGCDGGHAAVLKVASQHLVEENGLPAGSESNRSSRCELNPAKVSELGEGQGQHLYLDVAPGQVSGQLAREKVCIRAREVDIAIEVDPHRIDRIPPALDSLGLVYENVSAALIRQAPANVIIELVLGLDARVLAFQVDAHEAAAGDPFGLDGHPNKVEKARFTAPAYARDHLDEVGVAKEHRLFEVSVAAFQSVALQEMLLKLKSSFTFGSIITSRRKRSQEPISKDIGQNVCVSVGRCLQEESPAPSRPA